MRTSMSIVVVAAAAVIAASAPSAQQTVQDEYAVYELLAPDTSSFTTVYEVSLTTPGATTFFDTIGSGLSFVAGAADGVVDVMTGAPLKFEQEAGGLRAHLHRDRVALELTPPGLAGEGGGPPRMAVAERGDGVPAVEIEHPLAAAAGEPHALGGGDLERILRKYRREEVVLAHGRPDPGAHRPPPAHDNV